MYVNGLDRYNLYGVFNPISQKQFERGDFHVIWYAFVLRIWHFRTIIFFSFSLRKVDLTDSNCSTFYGFDKFEPFIYVEPFEWFEFVKSVKRRTIWSKFRRENKKNYCFESVKSVKRMHIRSHDNRLFRIVFVKSGCKPRILFWIDSGVTLNYPKWVRGVENSLLRQFWAISLAECLISAIFNFEVKTKKHPLSEKENVRRDW